MKKILLVTLVVIMVLGLLPTAAFAADPKGAYTLGVSGKPAGNSYSMGSEVRPDASINFYIYIDGKHALRQDIRADKIDIKRKASEGSRAIKNVAIKYDSNGYAYVKVDFIDPFVSTKEQDFTITLYLTSGKSRLTGSELELTGTLENYILYADENEDYINMSDYPLVEAEGYIKSTRVELGQGLFLHAKMFEGKRYYGYVSQGILPEDDDILTKFPSIDTIYHLQTINLNTSGNYVNFDVGGKYYVYNADLQYIGTTNDKLPYSKKYYLSSTELDIKDASLETDSIPSGTATENVPSGGDDVPPNYNNNPGTGC